MAKPNLKLSAKRNSGRGNADLERLLSHGEVEEVPLGLIDRDEHQPRPLDEVMEGIEAFADEIERDGFVLAQLPVYHIEDSGRRTIVVGERRTTAFKLKGRETIPAICKRFTDAEREQIFVLQFVENDGKLKKELSPIADARWWRAYADRYHQGKLSSAAAARGRTPAEISNRVSLLDADPAIQAFVQRADLKDPATYAALVRLAKHGNMRMVDQVISDYDSGVIRGSFRIYVEALARDAKAIKQQPARPEIRQPAAPAPNSKPLSQPEPPKDACAKALTRSMFDETPEPEPPAPSFGGGREALLNAAHQIDMAGTAAAKLMASSGSRQKLHYDRVLSSISDAIKALEQSQAAYTAERTALLAKG